MIQLNGPSDDIYCAKLRVYLLRLLEMSNDTTLLDASLQEAGFPVDRSYYTPGYGYGSGRGCPAYMARSGRNGFVFIGGVANEGGARAIWNGYIGGFGATTENVENAIYSSMGTSFLWTLTDNGQNTPEHVYVVGHSAGGCAGIYLAYNWAWSGRRPSFYLTSFGAPKPAGQHLSVPAYFADYCRWMCSDDVVPLIPPMAETWGNMWTLGVNLNQAARLSNFRQSAGGVQIKLDGTLEETIYPSNVDPNTILGIQTWMRTAAANRENAHSLISYAGRIDLAISRLPVTQTRAPGTSAPDVTPNVTTAQMRGEQAVQQTHFSATNRSTSEATIVIPPVQLFKAVRRGRLWYVTFGDIIIATAARKRGARQLARAGNAFLRSLQARAAVNADTLAQQFVAYLAAASDPTSGFVPQLHVV
jgi:hypothetical protein